MIPYLKAKVIFIGKKKLKTQNMFKNQKKCNFPAPSISNLRSIWEQFLQFKACKSVEIDAIGIEVAQQIKLSGCPTRGQFSVKNAFLPLLSVIKVVY